MRFEDAQRLVRALVDWRPAGGVVSVYIEIDPGDRSQAWRIALKDALGKLPDSLSGVAGRVLDRFPANTSLPEGRTHAGFLEAEGEREEWVSFQTSGVETRVANASVADLAPLMKLLDEGAAVGAALISADRVRMFEWELGRSEELDGWELEIYADAWRERKAQRVDPGRTGTGASASGHDQHAQRLEHESERFLKQAGELVAARYQDRPWRWLLVVGEGSRPAQLVAGLGTMARIAEQVQHDLIRAPLAEVEARIAEAVERLNRVRETEIVGTIEEAVGRDPGIAAGPDEVLKALEMGRVHHLIFDADGGLAKRDGETLVERLVSLALATDAQITPVEGVAAEALKPREGVAALLRY